MDMRERVMFARSLLFLLFIATLTACAGKSVDQNEPAALFKEAEEDIKSSHYQIALDKLRTIRNQYPYSSYAIDAQLRIADIYFLEESYPEAAANYESFQELHPKHEKAAYAMFRIGKSYLNDAPTTLARDLSSAQRAVDAYTDFLRRFPKDPHSTEAKSDMGSLRELLAGKEVYIGDFYAKGAHYASAAERYKKAIAHFPDTHAAEVAKTKLADAEEKIEHQPRNPVKEDSSQ